jgi:hydrogenase-4 membrane subunit HyfE
VAAYTIYLLISIAAVFVTTMSVIKNLYFRRTGVLMFGKKYKPDTSEYKRLKKIFSNRNLAINTILLAIFIVNLVFAISTIMQLPYGGDTSIIFIFAALFVIGIVVALTRAKQIKQAVEHNKDNNSWLS